MILRVNTDKYHNELAVWQMVLSIVDRAKSGKHLQTTALKGGWGVGLKINNIPLESAPDSSFNCSWILATNNLHRNVLCPVLHIKVDLPYQLPC